MGVIVKPIRTERNMSAVSLQVRGVEVPANAVCDHCQRACGPFMMNRNPLVARIIQEISCPRVRSELKGEFNATYQGRQKHADWETHADVSLRAQHPTERTIQLGKSNEFSITLPMAQFLDISPTGRAELAKALREDSFIGED
jgi:hypothetical protein